MTTGLPRPSECRECHEPIRFVELNTGKAMPVNPAPVPLPRVTTDESGYVAARMVRGSLRGFVVTPDRLPGPLDPYRFRPHYATCPEQRTPVTPTPDDPALF